MNLGHLDFDIVSNFDTPVRSVCIHIRISDFASLGIFTLVEDALQISSFLTNKANLLDAQMNVNLYNTTDYENKWQRRVRKNKPNSNPNKPNLPEGKIDAKCVVTKDYEEKCG